MDVVNHYKWLDKHLPQFWLDVFGKSLKDTGCAGIVFAHGDKGYQYRKDWEDAGIPFPHGMALYMLTYTDEMDYPKHESREWVIDNYSKYVELLPEVDESDEEVQCPFALAQKQHTQEDE